MSNIFQDPLNLDFLLDFNLDIHDVCEIGRSFLSLGGIYSQIREIFSDVEREGVVANAKERSKIYARGSNNS